MDVNERRARASAEAAEWWVRIETGDLSREYREEFVDWLRESAVHVAEMLRMAEVHGALEHFGDWARIPVDDPERAAASGATSSTTVLQFAMPAAATRRASPTIASAAAVERLSLTVAPTAGRRRWKLGIALAAAVAVLGLFVSLFFSAQVIETGRAERRSVTLADGSILQIDPQSRLRVRLEKYTRNVYLERGRALFRVAKDHERPFLVHADVTLVRAVGTQFGVEQAREGIVVTVAEGKVAVVPRDVSAMPFGAVATEPQALPAHPAARSGIADGTDRGGGSARPEGAANGASPSASAEVLLTAGQQVTVPRRGPAEPVRAVDTDRELAWVAGRLVFENESVSDVIDEFNRYNVVQLHVANRELAHRSVSGVFDASEPESFIGFMQSVASVDVHRAGQDITIALAP
ncbi:MAG: FecR domain-containing protein [Gammaproteobacteria bacterium]